MQTEAPSPSISVQRFAGITIGAVISAILGVAAMAALIYVFSRNASPYVSVAEAKVTSGNGLHVAGEVTAGSMTSDLAHHQVRFVLKDAEGQTMPVVYTGPPVSSIGTASKVVAIGAMKQGMFYSDKMLVKCPSKYETDKSNPK